MASDSPEDAIRQKQDDKKESDKWEGKKETEKAKERDQTDDRTR